MSPMSEAPRAGRIPAVRIGLAGRFVRGLHAEGGTDVSESLSDKRHAFRTGSVPGPECCMRAARKFGGLAAESCGSSREKRFPRAQG